MSNMSEDIQYAGSDTCQPMLDRTAFKSWQHRIVLKSLTVDQLYAYLKQQERKVVARNVGGQYVVDKATLGFRILQDKMLLYKTRRMVRYWMKNSFCFLQEKQVTNYDDDCDRINSRVDLGTQCGSYHLK
ncbi:hypothetical protein Tco_0138525 [Tanacetum coccineum]